MNALPPVAYIKTGQLHPNEANRPERSGQDSLQGLAETIRHLGILIPLFVKPFPGRRDHYVIVDGHQRYWAGLLAGVDQFPCTLRRMSPVERMTGDVLTEIVVNYHRTPWSPVEFALKLGQLRDGGLSQADIARITGISPGTISHHLRLLHLDDRTLTDVRSGKIKVGAAHEAVKDARAAAPRPGPRPAEIKPRRRPQTQPPRKPRPYFTATHPLAAAAHELCTSQQHPVWDQLGKVACGPCWEDAIRADQDKQQPQPAPAAFMDAAAS